VYLSDRSAGCVPSSVPGASDVAAGEGRPIHLGGITEFKAPDYAVFDNGQVVQVDAVIWGTGYVYKYDFLAPSEPELSTDDLYPLVASGGKKVSNLYYHLFSTMDPTLSFIGLPFMVAPFMLFRLQSMWVMQVLSKGVSTTLPDKACMKGWTENYEEELAVLGVRPSLYHSFRSPHEDFQWDLYRQMLAKLGLQNDRMWVTFLDVVRQVFSKTSVDMAASIAEGSERYRNVDYKMTIVGGECQWTCSEG
jgi:hypothetical protein